METKYVAHSFWEWYVNDSHLKYETKMLIVGYFEGGGGRTPHNNPQIII